MNDLYEAINKIDKEHVMKILTESLLVLRASIGISQDEMAYLLGITRLLYSYLETGKRKLKWTGFMALSMFFGYNDKTKRMIEKMGCFQKITRSFEC